MEGITITVSGEQLIAIIDALDFQHWNDRELYKENRDNLEALGDTLKNHLVEVMCAS